MHRADRVVASVYLADDSGGLLVVKVWDGLKVSRWGIYGRRREEIGDSHQPFHSTGTCSRRPRCSRCVGGGQ